MPEAVVNGVRLSYQVNGAGEPVLLVCGTGQRSSTWYLAMVPSLLAAGYQVVTFDNRGVPPSEAPPAPYTVEEMAADTAGLIEHLGLSPTRVVGYSLGAFITQELALTRPDLVRGAVLMGTFARQDAMRKAATRAWVELDRAGIVLPPLVEAVQLAGFVFSREALDHDSLVEQYLAFSLAFPPWVGDGRLGQHEADLTYDGRLEALAGVRVPCTVVAFERDLLTPPKLCREVAEAIPGATYSEIPGCGHAGPFEKPVEVVAEILLALDKA